jgi:hypothetical protein
MQRPGKNQRRRAKEKANSSAIDRLNAAVREQQKERIRKLEKQTVTTPNEKRRDPAATVVSSATTLLDLATLELLCSATAKAAAITAVETFKNLQSTSTQHPTIAEQTDEA